jgi:hypothetical protein
LGLDEEAVYNWKIIESKSSLLSIIYFTLGQNKEVVVSGFTPL